MNFSEKNKLFDAIKNDVNSISPANCRFPARFIFFDNFSDYKDCIGFFNDNNISSFDISSLLKDHDSWKISTIWGIGYKFEVRA